MPLKRWLFSLDDPFTTDMAVKYPAWNPNHTFDIFTFHSIWNAPEVDKLIPKPSARVTLLRDPVDLFESGYVYMGLEKKKGKNINEFAEDVRRKGFPKRQLSKCK